MLPWLLAMFGVQAPSATVSRLVVRDEIIIRVPVVRPRVLVPVRWVEKKGPKCIGSNQLLAASLANDNSIDFFLRDRRRIRAKMDRDCPTLDFYGGFYLQPRDQRICAGRDEIRSRIGGACQIERFRLMEPQRIR
jgi:hypothetical protein